MKIAFFTEGQYTGGISRNHPNMRTDVAWICALNAVHYPINKIHELQEEFDNLEEYLRNKGGTEWKKE